jgi:hypothetical protein
MYHDSNNLIIDEKISKLVKELCGEKKNLQKKYKKPNIGYPQVDGTEKWVLVNNYGKIRNEKKEMTL